MGWTEQSLTELVFEIVSTDLLQVDEGFSPASDLIAAGLDSLAVTQLLLGVEEATGLWLDESNLTPENLASCESLAKCLYAELGSS